MSEFSLSGFAAFLGGVAGEMEAANHHALEKAAQILEDESKRVIGTYDYDWPPLKPATIARKANGDTPLLETGELRDSINSIVGKDEANVGSDEDKAVWHELGTVTIPARSFLAQAAVHKEDEIVGAIGRQISSKLIGKATD